MTRSAAERQREDPDLLCNFFRADVVRDASGTTRSSGEDRGRDEVFDVFARLAGDFTRDVRDVLSDDDNPVVLVQDHVHHDGKHLDRIGRDPDAVDEPWS